MASNIEEILRELGYVLPETNEPGANYLAYKQTGNILFVAGQICKWNGELLYRGAVGRDVSVEAAVKAAEICALNLLLQIKSACDGSLDRLDNCLSLSVYVNSDASFHDHARVANGASDILIKCLGEKGRHTRVSLGCSSLPKNATVEVSGVFELENIFKNSG